MGSPRPRPASLRLLTGRGPGRDSGGRVVQPGPAFKRFAPVKPAYLSPVASLHWDEVVPELVRLDLVTPSSIGGLVALCEAWARFIAAHQLLAEDGVLTQGTRGIMRHPATAIANEASREYRNWADEFGLTPSSEGKVTAKDAKQKDDGNPFAPRPASLG